MRRRIVLALALVGLALSPVLRGRFLLDDVRVVRSLSAPIPGWTPWVNPLARPVYWATFRLERAVWGDRPFGHHLGSLILHLANTALLALLVLRLWPGGHLPASTAALAFGLHPLSASAACYVAERSHLLAAAGILGALHALLSRRPALAWLAWILALGSKETAVVFPLCLLPLSGIVPREELRAGIRGWALRASLASLVLGAAGLIHHAGLPPGERPGRLAYLLTEPGAVLRYLLAWILPFRLPLDADLPLAEGWAGPSAAAALLLLLLWAVARKAGPWASAAVPAALLALLPESSLVPLQDPLAMHRMYVPCLFLALAATPLLLSRGLLRAAWVAAALAITFRDASAWRSPGIRCAQDLRDAPRKLRVHSSLVQGHLARFRKDGGMRPLAAAERVLRRSLRIGERSEQRRDLALVLYEQSRDAEALEEAARADRLEPGRPDVLILTGYALLRLGREAEAGRAFEAARRAYDSRKGVLYSVP